MHLSKSKDPLILVDETVSGLEFVAKKPFSCHTPLAYNTKQNVEFSLLLRISKTSDVHINITLRRMRATTLAVEKQ